MFKETKRNKDRLKLGCYACHYKIIGQNMMSIWLTWFLWGLDCSEYEPFLMNRIQEEHLLVTEPSFSGEVLLAKTTLYNPGKCFNTTLYLWLHGNPWKHGSFFYTLNARWLFITSYFCNVDRHISVLPAPIP